MIGQHTLQVAPQSPPRQGSQNFAVPSVSAGQVVLIGGVSPVATRVLRQIFVPGHARRLRRP